METRYVCHVCGLSIDEYKFAEVEDNTCPNCLTSLGDLPTFMTINSMTETNIKGNIIGVIDFIGISCPKCKYIGKDMVNINREEKFVQFICPRCKARSEKIIIRDDKNEKKM